MKKALYWIGMNGGLAALVYAGFINDVAGAQYIVKFFVWAFCLPLGLVAAFSGEFHKNLAKEPKTPFRTAVSHMIAWATLGVLVWTGHVFTGAAWAVWMVCAASARIDSKKLRAESSAAPAV